MPQAIKTHYSGPTNARGSTIRASCDAGSVTIDYPHDLNHDNRHAAAAEALARKFGWTGDWYEGVLKDSDHVFVCVDGHFSDKPAFSLVKGEAAAAPFVTILDDRALATVLAALRRWQKTAYVHSAMHGPGAFEEWDIATNGGTLQELSYDEIDRLCDRLNA